MIISQFSSGGCTGVGVSGKNVWRDGIYLSLANTLFSYKKTKNASECCEWQR